MVWETFYLLLKAAGGSLLISGISIIIAAPIALLTAIYIKFYARKKQAFLLKFSLKTLTKMPVVVFAIIAYFLFTTLFSHVTLIAILTLVLTIYPTLSIRLYTCFKKVSLEDLVTCYALGASREFIIREIVLPNYMYKILGVSLNLFAKVIGLTIPLLILIDLGGRNAHIGRGIPALTTTMFEGLLKGEMGVVFMGSILLIGMIAVIHSLAVYFLKQK